MHNTNAKILETPYLLLDVEKLDANITRMRTQMQILGVSLRPHVKTNKSLQVSERFFNGCKGPITVSTLHEADYFFRAGYSDILYGVAIAPNKFHHAAQLIRAGAQLKLILDNAQTAGELANFAQEENLPVDILLEIDCDGHRSGLQPCSGQLIEIANQLKNGHVNIRGVMTHAGDSYNAQSTEEIARCSKNEHDAVVCSAHMLKEAGFAVDIISAGSTPTALFAKSNSGLTEVRAGVFAFFDLVMAGLGVCRVDEIALSVVTTVIGHQATKGWTITDAGWMALSRDRGTAAQSVDQGYGMVCNMDGNPIADLIVSSANQEHGIISSRSGSTDIPFLPIGTQLRILPNHACATAAQYNGYYLLNSTEDHFWPRINGWGQIS